MDTRREILEWKKNAVPVVKEPVSVLGFSCPVFKRPEQCLKGPDHISL